MNKGIVDYKRHLNKSYRSLGHVSSIFCKFCEATTPHTCYDDDKYTCDVCGNTRKHK